MATDGIIAFIIILGVIIFFGILLYAIPSIITTWILYGNAGKPGWAAIVPVYQSVVMAQIGKKPEWMGWVVGGASIASSIIAQTIAIVAGRDSWASVIYSFFDLAVALGVLALAIVLIVGFIQQYRHINGGSTAGFWVCYFLLPIAAVFMAKNIVGKDSGLQPQPAVAPGQQSTPPYVPPAP